LRTAVVAERVLNSYAYTAWGVPLNWHERIPNRYTYTSREYNPETSLYHYRTREYSLRNGRFLSRDPKMQTCSLYPYVANNPTLFKDPSGRWIAIGAHEFPKFKQEFLRGRIKGYKVKRWNFAGRAWCLVFPQRGKKVVALSRSFTDEVVWRLVNVSEGKSVWYIWGFMTVTQFRRYRDYLQGVVYAARRFSKRLRFGGPAGPVRVMKVVNGRIVLKVLPETFIGDLIDDPRSYYARCALAASWTAAWGLYRGVLRQRQGGEINDRVRRAFRQILERLVSPIPGLPGLQHRLARDVWDWIPGEIGYIGNRHPSSLETAGENVIYLGGCFQTGYSFVFNAFFWGHTGGRGIKTLYSWLGTVDDWSPQMADVYIDAKRKTAGGIIPVVFPVP